MEFTSTRAAFLPFSIVVLLVAGGCGGPFENGSKAAPTVPTPTFSPGAGSYTSARTVMISDTQASASFYYTVDGSTPSTSSTLYINPITVSTSETIKAIAVLSGYSNSSVGSATYTINPATLPTPTFSPGTGSYTSAQPVTISDPQAGASFYYTVDGSTPSTSSTPYKTPITVSTSETIKAIAVLNGYPNSSVGSATYTINVAPPIGCTYPIVLKPVSQPVGTVSISCMGGGAPTNFALDTQSPSLPSDLVLNQTVGTISGSLSTYAPLKAYTIDVSNAGGTTTAAVRIAAVTMANLQPGVTLWGADGHIDKGGIYRAPPDSPVLQGSTHTQIGDLEDIFGTNPNSIFYRAFDDITGCNDIYYNHVINGGASICDPTSYNYKQPVDRLQATGVIMPIVGLILYPFRNPLNTNDTGPAGCTPGSFDTTINVPDPTTFSELDMYNWGYCTSSRSITYAPEVMYWYVGNEWGGLIPIISNPGNANPPWPADGSSASEWQAQGKYRLFLGALAGAIAAIRDQAPYATIISGASSGPFVGLSVALGSDLAKYNKVDPNGRDLLWDVTSLHWGNNVESLQTAKANGVDYGGGGIALAFPDYTDSTLLIPGTNVYQELNSLGKAPSGTIPPIFVDEFGSGDGNDHDPALEPLTAPETTAQMLNFYAHSPASSTEPGLVGGNFYELYPSCNVATGCGTGADTAQFLYCYGGVCGDGNSGNLSVAGSALKAWITQYRNPSHASTPTFTLSANSSSLSVKAGQSVSTTIKVNASPGSPSGADVTLTCSVFNFPVGSIESVPACNFQGQQTATVQVGSAINLTLPTLSTTPSGAYVVFITAYYSGTTPGVGGAATDIPISLQVN